ncbi:MAG: 50S ribosomal protein L14e [Thermoproteota archaeon]|jgi:large subunit ribosomal protein L14e|uniref:50S ribosomal protein L14e n=1 Tax=Candidatus Methanodesulfokora washburnensis TaxID=2478471 RepID=A0A429GQX0_9CREN|nr:50S ribosomal protein L14e [Candidatus Methanodesulfokores washburnensis]RSN76194.1 50S ribosomal protein L14e [Candidatus Methanodesulfokores washburnensis]RZN62433.1 MAG: 50S ribosomal protein L14e [Candidatus Methanodesulfokores washburnensis]TDA38292.1 MAG: 50S ribosomal protein L14e [Candidatus Korarchaeota archaeon]
MGVIEVGRVCIKTAGREAGRKCVVVKLLDENFVVVTGPKELTGVKRRRVNVKHLVPLNIKIDIEEDADDKKVIEALKETSIYQEIMKERKAG